MEIRRANMNDIEGIMKLLLQVNNVHSINRPDLFILDKTKYTKEELCEIIKDDNKPIFVVVDEFGHILGHAFCIMESHLNDNNIADIVSLHIDDICVDENVRNKKVGTSIFEYVKEYAKSKGIYNITLNVWDKNDVAMSFYEKCGFIIQKYGMEIII